MATSATAVAGSGSTGALRSWDIIAAADADTSLTIAHGLGSLMADANDPDRRTRITLEPRGAKAYTQNWFVASIDATSLVLTKGSTSAGTGDAGSHVRVHVEFLAGPWT